MTGQQEKLLKVYNLLGGQIINKLDYLHYIDNEFYDIDDELKLKLAEKLEQAYLNAHNDVPILEIASYMSWLVNEDNEQRMTFQQILDMDSRMLGNDAFDYYYMNIC